MCIYYMQYIYIYNYEIAFHNPICLSLLLSGWLIDCSVHCLLLLVVPHTALSSVIRNNNSATIIRTDNTAINTSCELLSDAMPHRTPDHKAIGILKELNCLPASTTIKSLNPTEDIKLHQHTLVVNNMTTKKRPLSLPYDLSAELASKRLKQTAVTGKQVNISKQAPVFGLFHSCCKCSITCKSCGHNRIIEVSDICWFILLLISLQVKQIIICILWC